MTISKSSCILLKLDFWFALFWWLLC